MELMNQKCLDPALNGMPSLIPAAILAKTLHCSTRTIRRLCASGKLKALHTSTRGGGRLLFRREEVARYLAVLEGRDV